MKVIDIKLTYNSLGKTKKKYDEIWLIWLINFYAPDSRVYAHIMNILKKDLNGTD